MRTEPEPILSSHWMNRNAHRRRIKLYKAIEDERKRPLIVYVTSGRMMPGGSIGGMESSMSHFGAGRPAGGNYDRSRWH